jgi:hypothetical protein
MALFNSTNPYKPMSPAEHLEIDLDNLIDDAYLERKLTKEEILTALAKVLQDYAAFFTKG